MVPNPASHTSPLLGHPLMVAARRYTGVFEEELRPFNLGPSRLQTLDLLVQTPTGISISELAVKVQVTQPTMSLHVRNLESAGLVVLASVEHDRRLRVAMATPKGIELHDRLTEAWARAEEQFVAAMPAAQATALRSVLEYFAEPSGAANGDDSIPLQRAEVSA